MQHLSRSAHETEAFAAKLAARLFPGAVLALHGGLGAGKTAFVRGLAAGLGITGRVSSPTFTLLHEHGGRLNLYHFDLYRVDEDALYDFGAEDYFYGQGVCAIEWPEKAGALLPADRLDITLTPQGEDERLIEVIAAGQAHAAALEGLTI